MQIGVYGGVIAASYFTGSIPSGYLTGKARGIDIRQAGSGNIGATNTFRVLGKAAGIFVLLADACKGFVAAWFWPPLALVLFPDARGRINLEFLSLAAGASVVLGHNYTCWLRFKGGKGIATSLGVVLALVPATGLIVLAVWGIVLPATRYVSAASIAAAVVLPFATWLTCGSPVMVSVMAGLGLLAILKHRANIGRLLAGTESRIGGGKKSAESAGAEAGPAGSAPARENGPAGAPGPGGLK